MTPTYQLQCFIMEALRIDADAVHSRRLHRRQLSGTEAVRATGLYRELAQMLQAFAVALQQFSFHCLQQTCKYLITEARGRAAADIK